MGAKGVVRSGGRASDSRTVSLASRSHWLVDQPHGKERNRGILSSFVLAGVNAETSDGSRYLRLLLTWERGKSRAGDLYRAARCQVSQRSVCLDEANAAIVDRDLQLASGQIAGEGVPCCELQPLICSGENRRFKETSAPPPAIPHQRRTAAMRTLSQQRGWSSMQPLCCTSQFRGSLQETSARSCGMFEVSRRRRSEVGRVSGSAVASDLGRCPPFDRCPSLTPSVWQRRPCVSSRV
jgi:hypothetical protein